MHKNQSKMAIITSHRDSFTISTDPDKLDMIAVHDFLSNHAYWCLGIPVNKVQEAVSNSLNFGLYFKEKQIGYARVISDFSTMAYLCDVYVLPAYRGKALGKWLIEMVMSHPDLQGLRRWILGTLDAHGLYKQFGWAEIAEPSRWMEITHKNIYQVKK